MRSTSFKEKAVLVLGLGASGRSAAHLLLGRQAQVWGTDDHLERLRGEGALEALQKEGLRLLEPSAIAEMKNFELLILSPGVPQTHPLCVLAKEKGIPLMGEVELACHFLSKDNRVLGITGTNGKTTVTLLVTHLLQAAGLPAMALGNIGIPVADFVAHPGREIIVLELSSYQLETMSRRVLDAAGLLNITPDHLDRYESFEAYAEAKVHVADCLKSGAPLWLRRKDWERHRKRLANVKVRTFGFEHDCDVYSDGTSLIREGRIEQVLPVSLRGVFTHDTENFLAAYALCRELGAPPQVLVQAAATFRKPSHRVEFIREIEGVSFYDDSKGTNLDAVLRAVAAMSGDVILIAGGVHKGAPYTAWADSFRGKVKRVYAIGSAASQIKEDLEGVIDVTLCRTLDEAVQGAAQCAKPGDNVLLSPGCSSFDMFRDYVHRGQEFQRLVKALTGGELPQ